MVVTVWFTLLLLCTSAPLVLCCDQFSCGLRQVKLKPVDLVMEDYDVSLCQQILQDAKFTLGAKPKSTHTGVRGHAQQLQNCIVSQPTWDCLLHTNQRC